MRMMSKRGYILVSFVGVLGVMPMGFPRVVEGEVVEAMEMDERIRSLERQSGLRIVYRERPLWEEKKLVFKLAEPSEYGELGRFLKIFEEELNKYPQDFFRRGRILNVVFVKRHFFGEKPVEGLYDIKRHSILIDFSRSRGNTAKQRRNIHHELFHMIEIESRREGREALGWKDTNPPGFRYGEENQRLRGGNIFNALAPAIPGFATEYATTAPEEDRAEIFASMMMPRSHVLLLKWAERDQYLAKKMSLLKDFLTDYDSRCNQAFWDKILSAATLRGR